MSKERLLELCRNFDQMIHGARFTIGDVREMVSLVRDALSQLEAAAFMEQRALAQRDLLRSQLEAAKVRTKQLELGYDELRTTANRLQSQLEAAKAECVGLHESGVRDGLNHAVRLCKVAELAEFGLAMGDSMQCETARKIAKLIGDADPASITALAPRGLRDSERLDWLGERLATRRSVRFGGGFDLEWIVAWRNETDPEREAECDIREAIDTARASRAQQGE